MSADPLRERLAALVAEMRADADCAPYGEDPDATRLWADRLAALLREPLEAAPGDETMVRLARLGAWQQHAWYFDAAEHIDEIPPHGHEPRFETCPHPDCVAVRDAARAAAPEEPR